MLWHPWATRSGLSGRLDTTDPESKGRLQWDTGSTKYRELKLQKRIIKSLYLIFHPCATIECNEKGSQNFQRMCQMLSQSSSAGCLLEPRSCVMCLCSKFPLVKCCYYIQPIFSGEIWRSFPKWNAATSPRQTYVHQTSFDFQNFGCSYHNTQE